MAGKATRSAGLHIVIVAFAVAMFVPAAAWAQAIGGTCAITVTDNGPGIPPDLREKVFTPFFTTKSRGTGLGLATARRLIEAHQGNITIDCPPQGGTTVTIRLPVLA